MKDLERLDDYLSGAMADDDAGAYEDELFARAAAGAAPELTFVEGLRAAVRDAVKRGTYDLYLTAAGVERVLAGGARVQRLDLANTPEHQRPVLERDAELVITRLPIDLAGVSALDVEIYGGDRLSKVMRDVSFDPADGAIYLCCDGELARRTAGFLATTRFYARESGGGRRLVAELNAISELAG